MDIVLYKRVVLVNLDHIASHNTVLVELEDFWVDELIRANHFYLIC